MWERIANIWGKEVADSLRDRKAITQAIVLPLLFGVFFAVFNPWINSVVIAKAAEPLVVPAQGIEYAGQGFLDALEQERITLEPFDGDLRATVAQGEKGAGLIIPRGFSEAISRGESATLTLLMNRTAGGLLGGGFSAVRLDLAISRYSGRVAVNRMEERSLDASLLTPVRLEAQELSSPEQVAGVFAALSLPVLLAIVVVQGGMFVAIDVTAGEKERGTLEALLATPATDAEVFTGKLGAVFTITSIPVVLTLVGFWVSSNLLPVTMTNGAVVPLRVVVGAILIGLPLAMFLSVVLMIVSVRSKGFKDAQSATTPITLAVLILAMAAAFGPPTEPLLYLIPVYGSAALVGAIAIGASLPMAAYVCCLLGSVVATTIGVAIAMRLFNRERLLYGA